MERLSENPLLSVEDDTSEEDKKKNQGDEGQYETDFVESSLKKCPLFFFDSGCSRALRIAGWNFRQRFRRFQELRFLSWGAVGWKSGVGLRGRGLYCASVHMYANVCGGPAVFPSWCTANMQHARQMSQKAGFIRQLVYRICSGQFRDIATFE